MKKTKAKKKTLTPEEQKERLSKLAFKRKIRNIFVETGFEYIPTGGHEFNIGLRKEEIDSLFIYENIWLLCEDTIKSGTDNDHIRTKNEAFGQIKDNIALFRDNLTKLFPDKSDLLNKFENHRIKIFGLYFSKNEISLEGNKKELFSNLIFVQPNTLNYFQWISKCIKFSARTEILRFLNIKNSDIGNISSSSSDSKISAPIIYPETFTGLTNGVRVVSFMMSAKDMLDICYVLRKDNWAESIWLYQRLIDKEKIKNIRNFLEVKGEAFYNNIIVALPDNISFSRESADEGKPLYKKIDEIVDLDDKFKLILPKEMNSVCVIDGQHRIFAHYESGTQSKQEKKIAELRTSWANTESVAEKASLDNQLSNALKTIMAVSESYPELKANQNFSELSEELRNTENKISFSRQFYNDTVTMYNTKLEIFPSNIIAGMFNFKARDLFEAESEEARKNVKVDFGK